MKKTNKTNDTNTNRPFNEVAELWKKHKRQVVKQTTYYMYISILQNHLIPAFGCATQITEYDVQKFLFDKLDSGLKKHTVHDMLAVLRSVSGYGAKLGIFDSPIWEVEYPRDTTVRQLPVLSLQNHRKMLNILSQTPTVHNIGIMIALCCGLRIGEVCALRWRNVDFCRRVIVIKSTRSRVYSCEDEKTIIIESSPKTKGSNREVPMPSLLAQALRTVRGQQQPNAVFVAGEGIKPKEPRTLRETYKNFLRRHGIPYVVFHGLRHTFATRCIESQCDPKTVSAILGHSTVATTLNLYVHPNIDQKKRCLNRLDKFLSV